MLIRSLQKRFLIIFILSVVTIKTFGQWIQTNGPYCGAVTTLACVNNELFAGGVNLGINLSTNSGNSWTNITNGLYINEPKDIVADGTNLFVAGPAGVSHSINNGLTWTGVNSGLPGSTI